MARLNEEAAAEQAVDFLHLLVFASDKPEKKRTPTRVYLDTHPLHDYEPQRKLGTAWQGTSRAGSCRSLFMVDRLQNAALSSFAQFAKLHHSNLVTPVAFYCVADEIYVIHEYEGKSLSDVHPLPAQEASSILLQVCGMTLLQHQFEHTSHLRDIRLYRQYTILSDPE